MNTTATDPIDVPHPLPDAAAIMAALARFPDGYGLDPLVYHEPDGGRVAALRERRTGAETEFGAFDTDPAAFAALVAPARKLVADRLRLMRRGEIPRPKLPTLRERAAHRHNCLHHEP
jgi:hypothetical protein